MSVINKIQVEGVDYEIEDENALKEVPSTYKTKAENDELYQPIGDYATNTRANEIEAKIPDVSQFITNSVDDLINYYLKEETYTKAEVNNLIGAIQQFHYEIVQELPQTGASNVLYLVPKTTSEVQNVYDEYVYANNSWEKIGDTQIDLTGYVKNTDYADYETGGVVKVSNNYGTSMDTGKIRGITRTYEQYQSANNLMLISKVTLDNVLAGKGLVSNSDYGTSSTGGVVKSGANGFGIYSNGTTYVATRTNAQYESEGDGLFIGKGTLENVLNARFADYTTTANLTTLLANKQDTLVSGTNIKTINSTSILGSGNITTATSQDIISDKLTGTSAPATATVGYVGQQYTDTTNNNQYVCTAVNQSLGEYTWVQINGGGSEVPTYFWNTYDSGDSSKAIFKAVLEDWYNKDQRDNVLAMPNSSTDPQYVPLILQEKTKASVGYSKTARFNALLMGADYENQTVIIGRWYRAKVYYNLTLNDGIYTVTVTYIGNDQPTFSISSYGVLDYDGVNNTAYRRALKVDNTKAYTPTGDYNPSTKLYTDKTHYENMTGYDATKTQVLKNVQGVLQWQDES